MEHPICTQYGIDVVEVEGRLAMFDLSTIDERDVAAITTVISENIDALVDAFYAHLMRFPELSRFVSQGERLDRLRIAFAEYIRKIGKNVASLDYFEERLRVGVVHEKIGIAPKWHIAAYALIRSRITMALVAANHGDPQRLSEMLGTLQKLLCLDVSLAVETYHRAAIERIEELMHQMEQDQDQIRLIAQTDQLTELASRRYFLECLESEFHRCKRYGRSFCLLMIDIDDFKSVNDSFGHHAGDEVLRTVGKTISASMRSADICGRIGGEEFAIALVETALPAAQLIAERLRLAILKISIGEESNRLSTSISIGLAECTKEVVNYESLMQRADAALYKAKGQGKNCLVTALSDDPS